MSSKGSRVKASSGAGSMSDNVYSDADFPDYAEEWGRYAKNARSAGIKGPSGVVWSGLAPTDAGPRTPAIRITDAGRWAARPLIRVTDRGRAAARPWVWYVVEIITSEPWPGRLGWRHVRPVSLPVLRSLVAEDEACYLRGTCDGDDPPGTLPTPPAGRERDPAPSGRFVSKVPRRRL